MADPERVPITVIGGLRMVEFLFWIDFNILRGNIHIGTSW